MYFSLFFLTKGLVVLTDCELHFLEVWLHFYRVILEGGHDFARVVEGHHCPDLVIGALLALVHG